MQISSLLKPRICLLIVAIGAELCFGRRLPKPVLLIHGLTAGANSMAYVAARIKQHNPETTIYITDAYSYAASLAPLQQQLDGDIGKQFRHISKTHPEGFHVIGHSQGALLARTLIQSYINHTVHNCIFMAGILDGEYGTPAFIKPLLPLGEFPPTLEFISTLFYTPPAQSSLSAANFWHDPFQPTKYLKENTFLPYYNNEILTEKSYSYRQAIIKLKKIVCIFGPDDAVAIPWQTGDFSFYDYYGRMRNCTERPIYDAIGLRVLDEQGRFKRYIHPGVEHAQFVFDDEVISRYVLPHLD
nr:PREDICTED: lysosomal thioesterase PPT2 homolog [Bemisia tabaci]